MELSERYVMRKFLSSNDIVHGHSECYSFQKYTLPDSGIHIFTAWKRINLKHNSMLRAPEYPHNI